MWGGGNLYSEVDIMLEYGSILKFKMDPKLEFWVDSKSHHKQGFWQIFYTLKLGFFEFKNAKYHTLIKDMGSKSYPNPVLIVGEKHTLISYL